MIETFRKTVTSSEKPIKISTHKLDVKLKWIDRASEIDFRKNLRLKKTGTTEEQTRIPLKLIIE